MKTAKLIKKETIAESFSRQTWKEESHPNFKRAVYVVKDWIKERHVTQQEQARQMFAALFAQPQS